DRVLERREDLVGFPPPSSGEVPAQRAEGSWATTRLLLMTPPSLRDTSPYEWGGDQSGSGMNSGSPGTLAKRPSFQSALARSMRSFEEETKFHQIWRGPSSGAPPSSIRRAPSMPAITSTTVPA